jgi:hypothetical protein
MKRVLAAAREISSKRQRVERYALPLELMAMWAEHDRMLYMSLCLVCKKLYGVIRLVSIDVYKSLFVSRTVYWQYEDEVETWKSRSYRLLSAWMQLPHYMELVNADYRWNKDANRDRVGMFLSKNVVCVVEWKLPDGTIWRCDGPARITYYSTGWDVIDNLTAEWFTDGKCFNRHGPSVVGVEINSYGVSYQVGVRGAAGGTVMWIMC